MNIVQVNWKLLNAHSTRTSIVNSFCLKCMNVKLSALSKNCILFVLCEVCGTQRSPEAGVLCMECTFDWYICADTVASLCVCSIFVAESSSHRFQVE